MEYLLKEIKKHIITIFTVVFVSVLISVFNIGITSAAVAKTNTFSKVPVYGKNQETKIKKYLSSLPDKITVKKAKKKGIVISTYDDKINRQFQKDWMDFYKYARTGEKKYNKRAIVLLSYTVEGDACYTYLSFINGQYYVLSDSSRDKYKAGSWDGYSDLMVYKSLRKYTPDKTANTAVKNPEFYLFKKRGITRKEVIKIIKNADSYKYAVHYYLLNI